MDLLVFHRPLDKLSPLVIGQVVVVDRWDLFILVREREKLSEIFENAFDEIPLWNLQAIPILREEVTGIILEKL